MSQKWSIQYVNYALLIYSDIITQAVFVGLHKVYIFKKYELKKLKFTKS